MKHTGSGLLVTSLVALIVVACGGTGGRPPSAPALSGQSALDAQATLAVWSAQGTAVAAATEQAAAATIQAQEAIARATSDTAALWSTGTAVSAQATGVAQAEATAVAQATATASSAQATATWAVLVAQEKAISVQQTADAGAYALSATATADADIAAFMRAEAEQAVAERAAEVARAAMWNRLTPWLAGAVAVVAGGLVLLVVGGTMAERVRRARPQQAGDTWVLWHPEGPRVIAPPTPPRAALPPPAPRLQISGPVVERLEPIPLPAVAGGHMLIAGETGSGKSTAAAVVATQRTGVRVLDPHWNGRDWAGLEVVGGGRDFEAIRAAMDEMRDLLRARYAERLDGRDEFPPFTVFVDEMPAIVSALGRDVRDFWREWLREGRKVGLFLVLLTQSTRVRTLGIEGERDVLENFGNVLVLGKLAVAEHPRLVEGMARPAVLRTLGKALPVVIPRVEDGRRPAPAPVEVEPPQSTLPPVYATTEWPRREEAAIDLNNIDGRARQRIVDEYKRLLVIRQVQLKLFPNYADDGGKAGEIIRQVLAEAGMISRDADRRWRPTALALGYAADDLRPTYLFQASD